MHVIQAKRNRAKATYKRMLIACINNYVVTCFIKTDQLHKSCQVVGYQLKYTTKIKL